MSTIQKMIEINHFAINNSSWRVYYSEQFFLTSKNGCQLPVLEIFTFLSSVVHYMPEAFVCQDRSC